jgi:hypothetical protein
MITMRMHYKSASQIVEFIGRRGDWVYNTSSGEVRLCDGITPGGIAIGSGGGGSPELPLGGTVGQALVKIDSADYNVQWATPAGGGGGLTSAQALARGLGA